MIGPGFAHMRLVPAAAEFLPHPDAKVKHVLLGNHSLGKISKEQIAADFPVWHTSLHNPGWAAYARLCEATGITADRRDQLDQAMARLFAADGPAMLHVTQDPELL
jgi:thiamine pyrophosphate-dependent acetolactate synthase large subunit-like protein